MRIHAPSLRVSITLIGLCLFAFHEAAVAQSVRIENDAGDAMAILNANGDVQIGGIGAGPVADCISDFAPLVLTSNLESEFVIRNAQDEAVFTVRERNGGVSVAMLGTITANANPLTLPPDPTFIVADAGGNPVSFIDQQGNLQTVGSVTVNGSPFNTNNLNCLFPAVLPSVACTGQQTVQVTLKNEVFVLDGPNFEPLGGVAIGVLRVPSLGIDLDTATDGNTLTADVPPGTLIEMDVVDATSPGSPIPFAQWEVSGSNAWGETGGIAANTMYNWRISPFQRIAFPATNDVTLTPRLYFEAQIRLRGSSDGENPPKEVVVSTPSDNFTDGFQNPDIVGPLSPGAQPASWVQTFSDPQDPWRNEWTITGLSKAQIGIAATGDFGHWLSDYEIFGNIVNRDSSPRVIIGSQLNPTILPEFEFLRANYVGNNPPTETFALSVTALPPVPGNLAVGGIRFGEPGVNASRIGGPWVYVSDTPEAVTVGSGRLTFTTALFHREYSLSHYELDTVGGGTENFLAGSTENKPDLTRSNYTGAEAVFVKDLIVHVGVTPGGFIDIDGARFGDAAQALDNSFGTVATPTHGFLRYAYHDRTDGSVHSSPTTVNFRATECGGTIQRFIVFETDAQGNVITRRPDIIPTRNILFNTPDPTPIAIDANLLIIAEFN